MFPRLQCNLTSEFDNHLANIVVNTNGPPCEVWGRKCLTRCLLCRKQMCTADKRKWNGAKCALLLHSEEFSGLARSNYNAVHWKDASRWKQPNEQTTARNARHVKNFVKEVNDNKANKKSDEWDIDAMGYEFNPSPETVLSSSLNLCRNLPYFYNAVIQYYFASFQHSVCVFRWPWWSAALAHTVACSPMMPQPSAQISSPHHGQWCLRSALCHIVGGTSW